MAVPTLSRDEMLDIIAKGGSICFNGTIVNDPAYLPTEAQMAKGNPKAEADATAKLEAQMAALQAQMDALTASVPVPVPAPEEVAPEDAKDTKDAPPEDAKP